MNVTTSRIDMEVNHRWRDAHPGFACMALARFREDAKAAGLVEIAPDESRPGFTTYRAILPRPIHLPAVRTFIGGEPAWLRHLSAVAMCMKF
jgi:hypothetical protein